MADATGDGAERDPGAAFLRDLCHELRQPLVVATGYVSMLQDGSFGELPPGAAAILRTVEERLDALGAVIERVAAGAAGDAGRTATGG